MRYPRLFPLAQLCFTPGVPLYIPVSSAGSGPPVLYLQFKLAWSRSGLIRRGRGA